MIDQKKLANLTSFVVAIDGPAGVGKSSIANMVAKELGFFFLNSGNFYRAITLKLIENGIDYKDEKAVISLAKKVELEIIDEKMHLDKVDVEKSLHSDAVNEVVAPVSAIIELRYIVNKLLRKVVEDGLNVVCEGRDITTEVFPNAQCKFYLDASVEVRAKRRFEQNGMWI